MEHTLIRHKNLTVREKTGREGPRHDPYSYTELHVNADDVDIVFHDGLSVFILVAGFRTNIYGEQYKELFDAVLLDATGFTESQLRRFHRKASSRCPMGGYHDVVDVRGYPGESMSICNKCDKVVDSYFCEGAVI